jgi:4-amino-4-deoxy-L-arabinose transferase-like glycosyltransferase
VLNLRVNRTSNLLLLGVAVISLVGHCLVNGRYGIHRDELPVIDDAFHLAWGYVAYPPVTPFVARIALTLCGPSLAGLRLFSTLGFCVAIIVSGLMARAMGAGRWGQALAAAAVATAALPVHNSGLFQYVTFDYLAWVLCAYFVVRLLQSGDERWWLAVGAAIAFGGLSKYSIGVLVVGLAAGFLFTPARRYLRSKWLWFGVLLSLGLFLPHLLWELRHHFVTLEFLRDIHARDVGEGRSDNFVVGQLLIGSNVGTAPLWLAGLWFCLFSANGRPYRPLGWMYLVPLLLFLVLKGRAYYLAPAYPMLLAGGSVWWAEKVSRLGPSARRTAVSITLLLLVMGAIVTVRLLAPVARIGSPLWQRQIKLVGDFPDEIGWPELVQKVAAIYHAEHSAGRIAILCGNYGEAGAIDLYGSTYNLPKAISGVNSYWARGYGDPAPDTIVLVGFSREKAERYFSEVTLAGHISNSHNVANEETADHRDIFICRRPRLPWPELWAELRSFG